MKNITCFCNKPNTDINGLCTVCGGRTYMTNELRQTGQNKGCRERPTSMPNNDKYRDGWDRIFGSKTLKDKIKADEDNEHLSGGV